ncbi:hypothetical protein H5410_059542 [Solanum commersonii]|uniref:Uncharacterized protein n=1 Tax=Solanum commersonii TaxID=4109 RepID=A0A9J5W387_SOLCO|nr:hypothetical protein H5410_059542 [Solanum commersonii]
MNGQSAFVPGRGIIYWSEIFLIPKKVIQMIELVCRKFLWTGSLYGFKKALVAWEKLCHPKVAGGINLLDLHRWNQATLCKLLWNSGHQKMKLSPLKVCISGNFCRHQKSGHQNMKLSPLKVCISGNFCRHQKITLSPPKD